jgi:hypothetical protein
MKYVSPSRRARLAAREPRKERSLLFFRPVAHEHVAQHEVRAENAGKPHPPARQLLEHDRERRVIDVRPAVLFRHVQPEQPQRLHRLDEPIGILVAVLHGGRHGDHLTVHEFADGLRDELLMFREFH